MKLVYSIHWKLKKRCRKDIADHLVEYAIQNSYVLRDSHWENAVNAVCRVPPMGRTLKVVYRRLDKDQIKIITAFWLD